MDPWRHLLLSRCPVNFTSAAMQRWFVAFRWLVEFLISSRGFYKLPGCSTIDRVVNPCSYSFFNLCTPQNFRWVITQFYKYLWITEYVTASNYLFQKNSWIPFPVKNHTFLNSYFFYLFFALPNKIKMIINKTTRNQIHIQYSSSSSSSYFHK